MDPTAPISAQLAPATATPPRLLQSIWHTILTNGRDLILFAVIGVGLSMVGGLIDYVSNLFDNSRFFALVLPTLSNYLQGFSKFIGASLCATLVFMVLWPTLAHFGNHSFQDGWDTLSVKERFFTYVGTIMVALLAAALCFSTR